MPSIINLISTSVEDCKINLRHIKDLSFCQQLLAECETRSGQTSRIKVVKARINQLKKEGAYV